MNIYIALLRGVNVSGQKKIPMAELRNMLNKMDYKDVSTYIQSGNVVFTSAEKNTETLEKEINRRIQDSFGFDVPVLVKSKTDLGKIIQQNPYTNPEALENKQVYFVLLQNAPNTENIEAFQTDVYQNEKCLITKDCVYLLCINGYGNAKLNNNLIERKLKVKATTRNYRTMLKLMEMAR